MSNLPVTFEQRVKEKINETIANLVPEEDLDRLIRLQVEHFQRNDLPKLIKEAITKEMAEAIHAAIREPEWQHEYINGQYGASEAVKKLITENAGEMLTSMMGAAVQHVVINMRNSMPRY